MNKSEIIIENKKLQVLFEFDDSVYGKIKRCTYEDKIVYVINNKIMDDKKIIDKIEIKYGFLIPDELKNIIY